MAKQRRVLASQRVEAGRPVRRACSGRSDTGEFGAELSADEAEALDEELRAIDQAQQDALASGGVHYLGSRR